MDSVISSHNMTPKLYTSDLSHHRGKTKLINNSKNIFSNVSIARHVIRDALRIVDKYKANLNIIS